MSGRAAAIIPTAPKLAFRSGTSSAQAGVFSRSSTASSCGAGDLAFCVGCVAAPRGGSLGIAPRGASTGVGALAGRPVSIVLSLSAGSWNDARLGSFAGPRAGCGDDGGWGLGVRTFGGTAPGEEAGAAGGALLGRVIFAPGLDRPDKPGRLPLDKPGSAGRLPGLAPGTPPGIWFRSPKNGSSASTNSSQPENRASGSFAINRLTISSSPAGTFGDSSRIGIGSFVWCAIIFSTAEPSGNGTRPVRM